MIEFVDKEIEEEYSDLDAEALELEDRLNAINMRQQYLRDNYEQE